MASTPIPHDLNTEYGVRGPDPRNTVQPGFPNFTAAAEACFPGDVVMYREWDDRNDYWGEWKVAEL